MCSEHSRPALVKRINLGQGGTHAITFYSPALSEKTEQRTVPLGLALLRVLTAWPSGSPGADGPCPPSLGPPSGPMCRQRTRLPSAALWAFLPRDGSRTFSGTRQISGPDLLLGRDAFRHPERSSGAHLRVRDRTAVWGRPR